MCRVSGKLKLCTCSFNPETAKHYWGFMRFHPGNAMMILGEPMLPLGLKPEDEKFNRQRRWLESAFGINIGEYKNYELV